MNPEQALRQLAITTALGPDALVLNRVQVRQRLSGPFEIDVELSATDAGLDFSRVVGHPASIRLDLPENRKRHFHGIVSRINQGGNQGGFARYRATLVPWFWFLTRTSDCRVFQRKTVVAILEDVFQAARFGSDFYDWRTQGSFPTRRYCVQYRETDFNFVSRLMESEGIYYWFEHQERSHKLVLSNSINGSEPLPGYERLEYQEVGGGREQEPEVITGWQVEQEVQPVSYDLKDFDYKQPSDPLLGHFEVSRQHGMARFAVYDFPGEYFESGQADRYAQLRLEELQARHEIVRGVTRARGLEAGRVFELQRYPRADQNQRYLVTEMSLTADAGEFAAGGSGEPFFQCQFSAIPARVPFRAPRLSPKPVVQGVQTATVVGPAGEEIHTDDQGRVKVQFHWDRYGEKNENSSCWVRVSQAWAGQGWGSMITPRIGQEVIVEFLEGDPDRPIIVGRVYNAEQPPPYGSGQGVVSGLKSQTHKGSGSNEMLMDDTAGKEKITIHAQYDMGTTVEHDQSDTVHNNRTITIDGTHTETIKKDTAITIAEGKLEHKVNTGTADYYVKGAVTEKFDDVQSTTVKQKITIESTDADIYGKAKTEIKLETGTSFADLLKSGVITIDGGDKITIKSGQSVIELKKDGSVKISGTKVEISGTQECSLGTGNQSFSTDVAKTSISGASISASAIGQHEISGALVKIN